MTGAAGGSARHAADKGFVDFVVPRSELRSEIARLIADGADDAGSLTAQVMKNPISVELLDEIEKAHSSVLSTLLQLLDEGILRDVRNREISFRDTIVIATSNAGSNRIQEFLHRGYSLQQFEAYQQNFLKPTASCLLKICCRPGKS